MKYDGFVDGMFSSLSCQATENCLKSHMRSKNLEKANEEKLDINEFISEEQREDCRFKCHWL